MKLVATWEVKSSRLDRLLAAGCPYCRGPIIGGGLDDDPLDWTPSGEAMWVHREFGHPGHPPCKADNAKAIGDIVNKIDW